jgi:uncharacterized membrane protein YgcG
MRPPFADFSPTVPATFAAGIGISLSVFLLPAGVVQKGPTRVPAFGAAAGRVVADLPVAGRRASKVREAASAHPQIVVALRPATTKARQVHHRARPVVVRRAPVAPARAAAPAAPSTPLTRSQLFGMPPKAKGKARGHDRGDERESKAATPPSFQPRRGKARGRSNDDEDRLPPGLAKKAQRASAPGLPPRAKGNGHGNGRKGNGGGDRGNGKGGGDRGNGNGGGDEGNWEKKK